MGIRKLISSYIDVPLIIILIIIVVLIIGYFTPFLTFDMNQQYGTFATISVTLIGFLITAFSIILIIPNEGKIEELKKDNFFNDILYFFILAIFTQLAVFIFSLLGIFLKTINPIQNIIFLILFLISLTFLFYVVIFLKKIVDNYSEDSEENNDFLEE